MNVIRANGNTYPETRYTSVFLQENCDVKGKKKKGEFHDFFQIYGIPNLFDNFCYNN